MNLKIVKGAISGAIDAALSTNPVCAIVWGAIKGGMSEIRKKRAIQFVGFIENNCTIQQFNDPSFVDGIGITFEAFIQERSIKKHKIIQSIFLDFASAQDKESFELERLYATSRLISINQLHALKLFTDRNPIEIANEFKEKIFEHEISEDIRSLVSLGLVTTNLQVDIVMEDELEGDTEEDGYYKTGRSISNIRRKEYANITSFGNTFLDSLNNIVLFEPTQEPDSA